MFSWAKKVNGMKARYVAWMADLVCQGHVIFYTSIVKKQRARNLLNLKVENHGMTYRRQFEFIREIHFSRKTQTLFIK